MLPSEPTSGLDAALSLSLVRTLHDLTCLGVNVVTTLHQPRQEILHCMHKVILLSPCGRVLFIGPARRLAQHFSALGYTTQMLRLLLLLPLLLRLC